MLGWSLELLLEPDDGLDELGGFEELGGGFEELGGGGGGPDELGGETLEELLGGGALDELLGGALEEAELLDGVPTVVKTTTSAQRPLVSVMRTVMLPLPRPMLSTLKNSQVLLF